MRVLTMLLPIVAALTAPGVGAAPVPSSAGVAPAGMLSAAERASYRTAFAAIRAGDWTAAGAALDAVPNGALTPVARAQLYLAPGAPTPDLAALTALLAAAPELPQAPALARLARTAGATSLPLLPAQHEMVRLAGAPKRGQARPTRSDAAADQLAPQAGPLCKANDGAAAEPLVESAALLLTPEALTEWRQRVAWAYYLGGDDANARRVATMARAGSGEWAVQADWVLGLAAFRAGDTAAAAEAFAAVGSRARDAETIAAGLYWAARSDMANGHPERVSARLRSASRLGETFYGMLAGATLGVMPAPAALLAGGDATLLARPNARAAAALVEVDEPALADELLRQQARVGASGEHAALIALAERLDLPATQVWLARNGPSGTVAPLAARYPTPAWSPSGGWRVDRALLLAHALQESQFRTDAVSRAGAKGLMQLMPGTARLVARHRGDPASFADRMGETALNLEYGQSYLQELADNSGTGGLLPKVIAAYNAGPNNVALWNLRPGAQADPLLFIESIPFAETRGYVAIVLRNYWMYQRESGAASPSLAALAEGRWPKFPTVTGGRVAEAGRAGVTGGGVD